MRPSAGCAVWCLLGRLQGDRRRSRNALGGGQGSRLRFSMPYGGFWWRTRGKENEWDEKGGGRVWAASDVHMTEEKSLMIDPACTISFATCRSSRYRSFSLSKSDPAG